MSALPPGAVLTDIEGTTTPISFVRDVLFPFARERLPKFLAARAGDAAVAGELAETRRLAPGKPELETLLGWMAADAKMTPLKALQGMIWHEGYLDGSLAGRIYPDVPPSLRLWAQTGLRLYVYSSGSVEAQSRLAMVLANRLMIFGSDAADSDSQEVEALTLRALGTAPRDPLTHFARGLALRMQRRFEEAISE